MAVWALRDQYITKHISRSQYLAYSPCHPHVAGSHQETFQHYQSRSLLPLQCHPLATAHLKSALSRYPHQRNSQEQTKTRTWSLGLYKARDTVCDIRLSNVAENQKVDDAASCLLGLAAKAWAAIEHTKHQNGEVISLDAFFDTLRTMVRSSPSSRSDRKSVTSSRMHLLSSMQELSGPKLVN